MPEHMTLTVKEGTLAGRQYQFAPPELCIIGRAEDCELHLPCGFEFQTVSRRHCLLDLSTEVVRVRDLGSRNGTFVNGMPIGPGLGHNDAAAAARKPIVGYELKDGDELRLADVTFRVHLAPALEETKLELAETRKPFCFAEPCRN